MLSDRVEAYGGMVGGVPPVGLHRFCFAFPTELPARIGGRFAKANAAMRAQILRRVRRTVLL